MKVKKHPTKDGRLMLAVCDSTLIGKKFSEGKLQLDLTGSFYDGEEMNKEELKELIKKAYLVNMIGEESINVGIETGIITKEHIIKIEGVPHAQAIIIRED